MASSGIGQTSTSRKRTRLTHADYRIACIVPLGVELAALQAMLDEIHDDLPLKQYQNAYVLGAMGHHNVVIAQLPSTGNNDSGIVANQLRHDFANVQLALLVGVAGGIPSDKNDIRLGDVVIGMPDGTTGGVIQFDRGKLYTENGFQVTGHLNQPPPFLLATVNRLKARHMQNGNQIQSLVRDMIHRNPGMHCEFNQPGPESDRLFETEYNHVGEDDCRACDCLMMVNRVQQQQDLPHQTGVHYGTIGSSNAVIRNAAERDRLRKDFNMLAIETEAAGVMNTMPCLVIRGICDYADSHKNKRWQPYASATAAAYARELLQAIPERDIQDLADSAGGDAAPVAQPKADPCVMSTGVSSRNDNVESKYNALLDSLKFDSMNSRLKNIAEALPKTCDWLFSHDDFDTWTRRQRIEEHRGFLWIKGKPGSGKSTLMKCAHHWAKRKWRREKLFAYFFNARALNELDKSSIGFYRSLSYELLAAYPQLRTIFLDHFGHHEKDGVVNAWTIAMLQAFLNECTRTLQGKPLNIFVDALDEGDEDDVRQLVAFLENLARNSCLFDNSTSSLRICLSSRHFPHISIRKGLSLVVEEQAGHKDDLKRYIETEIVADEDAETDQLRERVFQKSAGIFLWVVLVVPILNKAYDKGRTVSDMEQRLDGIPQELDELFTQILNQSDEDTHECLSLFQWMLFSRRALSLIEADSALQGSSSPPKYHREQRSIKTLKRYVLNTSRGLVETTESEPHEIQFIHETVRDFLRRKGLAQIDLSLTDANSTEAASHNKLKSSCLHFLIHYGPSMTNQILPSKIEYTADVFVKHPFLEYAVTHIFEHADLAEAGGVSQQSFFRRLRDSDEIVLYNWVMARNTLEKYKVRKYSLDASLLYIIVEQDLRNLVSSLISDGADVDQKGERYGFALQAAAAVGSVSIVDRLIKAGANINAEGGEFGHALFAAVNFKREAVMELMAPNHVVLDQQLLDFRLFIAIARGYSRGVEMLLSLGAGPDCLNSRGESALYVALAKNKIDVFYLLVERGADVNTQCGLYGNALQAVCSKGREDLARFLVERGADVNTQGGHYGNILQAACSKGREDLARFLVDRGANVNAQGGHYGNALQAACSKGRKDLAHFLVEKGADVNAQGGYYGNALSAAYKNGYQAIARFLVENGIDVNTKIGHYGNVLQTVCYDGHEDLAHFLVEKGADVNTRGGYCGSALLAACYRGYGDLARFLVEKGADVNTQGGDFGNILQAACYRGYEGLARFLGDRGANVNAQGGDFGNALQAACYRGFEDLAHFLVEKGADVNTQGGFCGSALQAACHYSHQDLARFLVEKGADVNAQGGYFGNALQAACYRGCQDLARFLVEKGADINAQGGDFGNALQIACYRGHQDLARFLVEKGADIHAQGGDYGNALQAACHKGHQDLARFLVEKGADVNAQGTLWQYS